MKTNIRGIIVWFIGTLYVAYAFCLNTASAVFADSIQTTFHLSNLQTSLAFGTFILGFACMQIPAGYMMDKFNARTVVASGLFLMLLGNATVPMSTSVTEFSIANLVLGAGAAFAFVATAVLIAQWFPSKYFPILIGLMQTIASFSAGTTHYYFTVLLQTYSWNYIYFGLAKFGMVLLAAAIIFVRTVPGHKATNRISFGHSLKVVMHNKQIIMCCIAAATSFGVLLAYAGLWYLKVQEYYQVARLDAVIISGIIFLGIGIGTPLLGWYSNFVKSRVMVIHTTLVLGVMALMMGLYLPRFDGDNLLVIQIVSFFIGFLLSGSLLFYTMVSEAASDSNRGVALSILNTCVFLCNTALLFIPFLFVTSSSKDFFTYLWVLLAFPLISILLVYFIKDTYRKDK